MIAHSLMQRGKIGLFSEIERIGNLTSARIYVGLEMLLTCLSLIIYFAVPELKAGFDFLVISVVLLCVSLAELAIVNRKDGVGNSLKWIIGVSFLFTAVTATSTMGISGCILFVFPMLLSMQYGSLMFSIFMSVITFLGTFIPLLLTSFLDFYELNVIKVIPGSVITVSTTLENSLRPEIIDVAGTKVNELLAVFLPAMLFVTFVGIVACINTYYFRKNILEQYRNFQNTRE